MWLFAFGSEETQAIQFRTGNWAIRLPTKATACATSVSHQVERFTVSFLWLPRCFSFAFDVVPFSCLQQTRCWPHWAGRRACSRGRHRRNWCSWSDSSRSFESSIDSIVMTIKQICLARYLHQGDCGSTIFHSKHHISRGSWRKIRSTCC